LISQPLVVVTHRVHEEVKALLQQTCRVIANNSTDSWPREKITKLAREADALMVFMPDSVDDGFLAQCSKLKIIAAALKGCDNFDVAACTRRGIWFTIVPDLLSIPTAELALGLMLGITRNIAAGNDLVRSGNFLGWRPALYGSGLHGRTIGIAGMGKLGRALARLLAGFNATLIYADPVALTPQEEALLRLRRLGFKEMLEQSDIVVALLPLNDSTLHVFNAAAIAQMKQGSYLVNVGRGSVVDENAVADALDSGHLAGYAADVFEMEDWARIDHPLTVSPRLLRHTDRTLFTPHLGSAVDSVRLQIELAAAGNIISALAGEHPADAVNDPVSGRII
jgi:phosphonate dehydrogenase